MHRCPLLTQYQQLSTATTSGCPILIQYKASSSRDEQSTESTGSSSEFIKSHKSTCIFIGPESDHFLLLSVTSCCLVDLIDVTLADEGA